MLYAWLYRTGTCFMTLAIKLQYIPTDVWQKVGGFLGHSFSFCFLHTQIVLQKVKGQGHRVMKWLPRGYACRYDCLCF